MNIPPELIPAIITAIIEFSREMAHEIGKKGITDQIDAIQDNKTFQSEIEIATHSALQRWFDEYTDRELAALFAKKANLLTEPAMLEAIQSVARDPFSPVMTVTLHGKFKNLLPNILDETRLERGIAALLEYLREEFITVQAVREIHNAAANLQTARNTQELPEQTKLLKSIEEKLGKIACPPTLTDQTRLEYLLWVVNQHENLDLCGLPELIISVPVKLKNIYITLKAQNSISRADRKIMEQELDERVRLGYLTSEEKLELFKQLQSRFGENTGDTDPKPIELTELVRQEKKLIILGDPGAGKTTLLRWLALRHAEAGLSNQTEMEDLGQTRLPIFTRIADYAEKSNEKSLEDFLLEESLGAGKGKENFIQLIQQELAQGNCLILLDGLDEIIKDGTCKKVLDQINALIPYYEKTGNCLIITTRSAGYYAAPLSIEIPHYRICDMALDQIRAFLKQWCPAVEHSLSQQLPPEEQAAIAQSEIDAITWEVENNPGIQRLAGNPLFLRLLALYHRTNREFPNKRIELYQYAAKTLLNTWDVKQHGLPEQDADSEILLSELAAWMHEKKDAGIATESEVKRLLVQVKAKLDGAKPNHPKVNKEVDDFLSTIRKRSGIFVNRGGWYYGFVHLTFEEYFAALWLAQGDLRATSIRIRQRLHQARWEEPILLAIALRGIKFPDEVDDLFCKALLGEGLGVSSPYEDILHRDLLFATHALADQDVSTSLCRKLVAEFSRIYLNLETSRKFNPLREQMASIIHSLHSRPAGNVIVELLLKALQDDDWNVRSSVIDILENLNNHPQVITSLLNTLRDESWEVRVDAVNALGNITDHPKVVPALLHALQDPEEGVRTSAVYALQNAIDHPRVIPSLLNALKDPYECVRTSTVEAFQNTTSHPQVVLALLATLQDPDEDVHALVISALQNATENPKVITTMLNALQTENRHLRDRAVDALEDPTNHPEVIPALLTALKSPYVDVRWRAADALSGALDYPQVVPALLTALQDQDEDVRIFAAKALQNATDNPEIISALLNALQDPDEDFRALATEALQTATDNPEVISALLNALQDRSKYVRALATEALQSATDNPEVISALLNTLQDKSEYVRARAAFALQSATDYPEVISALLNALQDPDEDVRALATEALQNAINNPEVIYALLNALQDPDEDVRASAAFALQSATDNPEVIYALLNALQDRNKIVRAKAAFALKNATNNPEAISTLLNTLQDKSEYVRFQTTISLASIAQHPGADHPAGFADQLFQALSLPGLDENVHYSIPSDELFSALMAVAPGPQVPEE